ncbi:MAG: ribosome-binding factor A, partial [Candidatus Dormibacteraceae bacterium]
IEAIRSLAGLRSASGLIRHQLGKRLESMRYAPNLRFQLDPSIEYSVEMSKRMRELKVTNQTAEEQA